MKSPWVYLNGKFVKLENAKISILDRGFTYGDGIFETMRTYKGKIFRIDLHWQRMKQSAKSIYLRLPFNYQEFKKLLDQSIRKNKLQDAFLRCTVTRGRGSPGLALKNSGPPTVVVYSVPVKNRPAKQYENGISVVLFPNSAARISGLNQQIKSCNYLSGIVIQELALRAGAFEGILMEGNEQVTEGTVSNLFLIKNGRLKTPRLDSFVLPGVTRQVVMEIAYALKIPFVEKKILKRELYQADEVFLTNTGIEILPVVQVDDIIISKGVPGNFTQRLRRNFRDLISPFQ